MCNRRPARWLNPSNYAIADICMFCGVHTELGFFPMAPAQLLWLESAGQDSRALQTHDIRRFFQCINVPFAVLQMIPNVLKSSKASQST